MVKVNVPSIWIVIGLLKGVDTLSQTAQTFKVTFEQFQTSVMEILRVTIRVWLIETPGWKSELETVAFTPLISAQKCSGVPKSKVTLTYRLKNNFCRMIPKYAATQTIQL